MPSFARWRFVDRAVREMVPILRCSFELPLTRRAVPPYQAKKKKHNEATQNTLRMQRQQIVKLKLDNDRMKEDLALETRQSRTTSSLTSSSRVDRLKDEADEFARKIMLERKRMSELQLKIKELDEKANRQRDEMRSHMQGFASSRDYNLRVQREIRRLETRLDKARIKYNEAQAHNNKLREQIDNLRKDRDSYDVVFKRLTKELKSKKSDVQRLIKASNEAYKSRGEAQAEMMDLKARADKEQHQFKKELSKLSRTMAKEQAKDETAALEATGGSRRRNVYDIGDSDQEQKLRESVNESGRRIAKSFAEITASKSKVKEYEKSFEMIQKATKISDIDKLVDSFISAEERNFNLFNQVNELTAKIERQDTEVEALETELARYKDVGAGIAIDKTRKQILSGLQKKQKATSDKASLYEKKYVDALKMISSMKGGVKGLFDMIDCKRLPGADKLVTEGITETNMGMYLGMIEEQVNEILDVYQQIQDEADEKAAELEEAEEAGGEEQPEGEGAEGEDAGPAPEEVADAAADAADAVAPAEEAKESAPAAEEAKEEAA